MLDGRLDKWSESCLVGKPHGVWPTPSQAGWQGLGSGRRHTRRREKGDRARQHPLLPSSPALPSARAGAPYHPEAEELRMEHERVRAVLREHATQSGVSALTSGDRLDQLSYTYNGL